MSQSSLHPPRRDGRIRTHRTGLTIVWVLLGVAVLAFQALYDAPFRSLFHDALFDSGHILIFALVTWAVLRVSFHWKPTESLRPGPRWLAVGLFVSFVAVASEAAQINSPRDADIGDLSRNLAGAAIVLILSWSLRTGARDAECAGADHSAAAAGSHRRDDNGSSRRLGVTIAALLVLVAFAPLLQTTFDYVARNRAFPTLCRFTGGWEQTFVGVSHGELENHQPPSALMPRNAHVGKAVLFPKVSKLSASANSPEPPDSLRPKKHSPGFWIREVYPDWTGYDNLVFDLFSEEQEPFQLVLRIHDAAHDGSYEDRFHRMIHVPPGESRVSVPLAEIECGPQGRNLDLSHVRMLVLYALDPVDTLSLCIGEVKLEREAQSPSSGPES